MPFLDFIKVKNQMAATNKNEQSPFANATYDSAGGKVTFFQTENCANAKPKYYTTFELRYLSTVRENKINPCLAVAVLAVAIALPNAIGGIGTLGASPGQACTDQWYSNLDLPPWMPPGWVFGVMWPILYSLMGISSFMLWFAHVKRNIEITVPILCYVTQLILNGIWTPVFFGQAEFDISLAIIIILFFLVVACFILFARINIISGLLLIPYIIWLCIAISLNIYIADHNPNGVEANLNRTVATTMIPNYF